MVDVGICCREVEKRMKRLGLHMQNVKAIFISHEHSDHIKGLAVLCKKYSFPVYITSATFLNCGITVDQNLLYSFKPHEPVVIGDLKVTAFPKFHDACDPYSFVVECNNIRAGVFTDIGTPCANVVNYFKQCHAAFLEANYDEQMLEQGNYPYHLKKRIAGDNGHLGNRQALELFTRNKPEFMSHLLLSHLSENNNCPKVVQKLFDKNSGGVKITVASRSSETELFSITASKKSSHQYRTSHSAQLAFSFI